MGRSAGDTLPAAQGAGASWVSAVAEVLRPANWLKPSAGPIWAVWGCFQSVGLTWAGRCFTPQLGAAMGAWVERLAAGCRARHAFPGFRRKG